MIPGDEVVATESAASNDFIFILKEYDIFPIEIILNLHKFDYSVEFPVSINGSFGEFEMRFIKKYNGLVKGQSTTPIYNLKFLQTYQIHEGCD